MPFLKVTLSFFGEGDCCFDPPTWCFGDGCYLGVLLSFSFFPVLPFLCLLSKKKKEKI
jgi:hypothetical protein